MNDIKKLVAYAAFVCVAFAGTNEWTNAGPEGGDIRSIVIDPRNSEIVYAATDIGLFKSKDRGRSWSNAGLKGSIVGNLAIDPQHPEILYALTLDYPYQDITVENTTNTRLFKSIDGGQNWAPANSNLAAATCCVNVLAIDSQNPSTVYAGYGTGGTYRPKGGVLKSTDGAATWQAINSGLPGTFIVLALAIHPRVPETIYAAGYAGGSRSVAVFKSTDGGATWDEFDSGLPASLGYDPGFIRGGLSIDSDDPRTLYVSTASAGVFKSTDGGASWSAAGSGLIELGNNQRCCVSAVVIDTRNPASLYVADWSGAIFKSIDGGANWMRVSSGAPPPPQIRALAIDPQDSNTIYAATLKGAFKSSDAAANWTSANSGLRAVPVLSTAVDPQIAGTLFAGTDSGVFRSTNGGTSWADEASLIYAGWFGIVALTVDPRDRRHIYAGDGGGECGIEYGTIFKSSDGGTNWGNIRAAAGCPTALVLDPQSPSTLYTLTWYKGVLKSIDGGENWKPVTFGGYVTTLAIDPHNSNKLYAGVGSTIAPLPGIGAGLFRSMDGGATWSTPTAFGVVSGLVIDREHTNTIYAIFADRTVWKSEDEGARWRRLPLVANALAVNPQDSATLYGSTSEGVFRSMDHGESWALMPGSPKAASLLAVDANNSGTLYAVNADGLFAITPVQ